MNTCNAGIKKQKGEKKNINIYIYINGFIYM